MSGNTAVRGNITRRAFLLGTTALGAGVLAAACGQPAPAMEEKAEMAPEQKEEAKAEAQAPSGPQGEALYWHRGFFDFEPWAKEFAEQNPGLTMNAVGEADRLNKFKAAVAAGGRLRLGDDGSLRGPPGGRARARAGGRLVRRRECLRAGPCLTAAAPQPASPLQSGGRGGAREVTGNAP